MSVYAVSGPHYLEMRLKYCHAILSNDVNVSLDIFRGELGAKPKWTTGFSFTKGKDECGDEFFHAGKQGIDFSGQKLSNSPLQLFEIVAVEEPHFLEFVRHFNNLIDPMSSRVELHKFLSEKLQALKNSKENREKEEMIYDMIKAIDISDMTEIERDALRPSSAIW